MNETKHTPEICTGLNCPVCHKRLVVDDILDMGFIKRANNHDALLAACKEGLHECERVKMHCTCKHKDLGSLLKRIERIEAAIALAEKG